MTKLKKEEIGSDDSFELLVCFYFCFPILKVFLNIQKNQDFFQDRPNPKSPNDPWWLCILYLIWWEMNCKIDLWCISVGIEMKHLSVWELYIFEKFPSIWVNQVFSLIFFINKMRIDLDLIWFSEFYLCAFISHCWVFEKCCFGHFGGWFFANHIHSFWCRNIEAFLYYTYTIVIRSFLSILCLRTRNILSWGELISVMF